MNTAGYAKPDGPLLSTQQPRITPKSDFLLQLEAMQAKKRAQPRARVTQLPSLLRRQAE